ncbi:MAG: outer membrane protein assembly factor BamE [Alphaproteobacteria bacterium]|nr:outer membrane protein assembly factor BamE [Alphaproteobacteria bacterium]
MSTHNIVFSTLVGALLLSSCSTDIFNQTEGNMPSKSDIMRIKQGMHQEEVRSIMGSPSAVSSLDHRTWIYMNSTMKRMAFFEPEELDRNVIAIEFDHDGNVKNMTQLTKENGKDIVVSKEQTPVMGNQPTFMEKYFGGVGYMPVQPTKENDGL